MKAKKLLAVLMTAAVLTGTAVGSVTTFAAAPDGSITVTLPEEAQDAELKYVQIITEDRESPQGWTFATDGIRKAFVNAWNNADAGTTVTEADEDAVIGELFGIAENSVNANVKQGAIHSSVELSRALAAVQAATPIENRTLDPDNMGLYMITASKAGYTFNPMTVYVGPEFNGETVLAKGAKDQITKSAGATDHTVSSGDILSYEIEAQYPYYPANADNKEFEISDTIENAKFVQNSVEVYIAGERVGEKYNATFEDEYNMTVVFDYDAEQAGKAVVVKYKAVVGDIKGDADIKVKNNAKGTSNGKYTVSEVISDSAMFTITKVDAKDGSKLLPGAEFTLYVEDDNSNKTIKYGETDVKVSVVETKETEAADNGETESIEEKGKVTFFGLDPEKTYYVEETKAPEGYKKLDEIWKLDGATFNTSTTTDTRTDTNGNSYTVVTTTTTATDYTPQTIGNTNLSSLPSTGGIGTTIFTIGGCVIMIAAAGLFFASRRKEEK